MNPFEFIIPAIQQVFVFSNISLIFMGLLLGVIIGTVPGLNVTMGVILLLPLTYSFDSAASAIIALMSVYVGGMYGGSISAILLNTPGTAASIASTFDGYPLAKQGKANKALSLALFASVYGGIFASLVLLIFSSFIAQFVGTFASPEYFVLGVMGISLVAGISENSLTKGIISALIGIFIANIGADAVTGVPRFTFGSQILHHGIDILPTMIALIAMTQCVLMSRDYIKSKGKVGIVTAIDNVRVNRKEIRFVLPACLRSSIIGSFIGALPGTGGSVSQFMCYNEVRRASKRPQDFGKGSLEGVAAAESGNNSVATACLIPLLTLGIPGDGVTALLLGAFILHGVQPGPAMFANHGVTTYSIMIGTLVANVMLIFIGLIFTRLMAKVIQVRYTYLAPTIIGLCFAGAFAASGHVKEVILAAAILVFSYGLTVLKISVVPLMLGMILADVLETNFITSMMAYGNDPFIFFKRPISLSIVILTVVLVWSLVRINKRIANLNALEVAEAEKRNSEATDNQMDQMDEDKYDRQTS